MNGEQFGSFNGQSTSLLCGGTLALDQDGNVMAWTRKPGSVLAGRGKKADEEAAEGAGRVATFLESIARRIKAGRIGEALESSKGMVAGKIAPFTARTVDGGLRFELSPHFGIHSDEDDEMGEPAMADKLLIRAYNVGVGDCIYCRIPKAIRKRQQGRRLSYPDRLRFGGLADHAGGAPSSISRRCCPMQAAARSASTFWSQPTSTRTTSRVWTRSVFANIKIGNIWMNVAMDRKSSPGGRSHKLHGFAMRAMRGFAEQNLALSPGAAGTGRHVRHRQ